MAISDGEDDGPGRGEIYQQVLEIMRVQGATAVTPTQVDQFAALVMALTSDPQFCENVDIAVKHGLATKDWSELMKVFQAKGINASPDAVAYFVTTENSWYRLRKLAELFGNKNVGTFN